MKRLFCFFCACLVSALCLCAQDRKSLEDSVIVGGIPRSVVDMVFENAQMSKDEKLVLHWTYAELMKSVSREHIAVFSDQELQTILDYYRTDAFRYLSSETFYTTYIENIGKALRSEAGAGAKFSYTLRDKSYGAGLKTMFQSTLNTIRPVVDDMLSEDGSLISSARRSAIPESHIQLMISSARKVIDNLYNIYLVSCVDYLSKDALKPVEDFAVSALGQKYADYTQKVWNAAEAATDDFIASLEGRKANSYQLKLALADYVSLAHSFPEYIPELYRPYAEFNIGDSRYQGQTRDKMAHGKGRLTDKKGVVYEGDFKYGKRHGMLQVTKPGKETQTQFWISDKYVKNVPVGKDKDGVVPPVHVEDGRRCGYGSYYDSGTGARYQGVFVDGQLNGVAKVFERGRTVEGEFVNGKFVSGTISWSDDRFEINDFRGKVSADYSDGIRRWVAKDGSRKEQHIGKFKAGLLEGRGHRSVMDIGDRVETSGTFAYGRLYGKGLYRHTRKDVETGASSISVYDGNFFADLFHGKGNLRVSQSNLPQGSASFTICGVRLPVSSVDSLEVIMNGRFDEGSFKEGRISFSDGSWMEGTFTETGLAEGKMLRKYSDGSSYLGDCYDSKFHGYGVLHYPDGSVYEGRFEYGSPVDLEPKEEKEVNVPEIRYDKQTYRFRDLSVGDGRVSLIKPAGVKIMVRTVSTLNVTCAGRFKGDIMLEGKVTMSDGNWLEGVFEDGILIEGKGKTVDKYKTVYEGDIRNGYPHGNGKCTYADGTWFIGKFANGNRMGGTHYAADGKVIKVYK